MSTLARYVVTRFLRAFFGSLLILLLAVLVVDMLLNLEDILEVEDQLSGVLRYLLLRTFSVYLPYMIPVATFTGAFFSVGQRARNLEIVAMKAGGVSPLFAMIPLFVAAAVLSIVSLLVNETLTVGASAALQERSGTELGEIELGSGTIWYHTGRYIYNMGELNPDTGAHEDVRIYERDETGRLVRMIHAKSGVRSSPVEWTLDGATSRTFSLDSKDSPPLTERFPELVLSLGDSGAPELLRARVGTVPVWTLLEYARATGVPRVQSVLHQRLTAPLLVLVFALLAVPLGLRVERTRSLALPALQGVSLLFLFLLTREYAATFGAGGGTLPAIVAPWLVLTLFVGLGATLLARADT
ncbi:MAG: LptF/LptG family permease [Myxococcota bacterium]